jgi:hypothetical protein
MKVKSSLLNESLEMRLVLALELPGLGDMTANLPRGPARPLEPSQLSGHGPGDSGVLAQVADDLFSARAKAQLEIGAGLAAHLWRDEALLPQILILIRC